MILSVPIQLFILAQQKGFKRELSFFLLLKLLYPGGKTKLNRGELLFLELTHDIKSRKTTKKYIKKLIELGFIVYNPKTRFYILRSFDRIRERNELNLRLAFPIDYNNYNKLNAVTGAVIYSYLHKDFWRKVKRAKSVLIKGSTYNFPSTNFNYKRAYAPVSVYGVKEIFDISIATAQRVKKEAHKAKYLSVKNNLNQITKDEAETLKEMGSTRSLRHKKGQYYLQSIDTVCPLFYFHKRKSLK